MGGLAGAIMMVMPFRRTERHGDTACREHHQCDVHNNGYADYRTD